MFSVFRDYLLDKIALSQQDIATIESVCHVKKLRKNQYLLQQGEVWQYNAFVCSGCVRRYITDDKGCEHILQFSTENWWAGDRESLLYGTPAKHTIDAVEDTVLILIGKDDFNVLCQNIPALFNFASALLEKSAIVLATA